MYFKNEHNLNSKLELFYKKNANVLFIHGGIFN